MATIEERLKNTPHIDHGILGRDGKLSRRVVKAEMNRVFGGEHLITAAELRADHLARIQPTEIARLEREARLYRDIAARGMGRRKYTKLAEKCEAKIVELRSAA